MSDGRGVLMATPEKAILDLLYLNPFYRTEKDIEELRLDWDFMSSDLDVNRLDDYLARFASRSLDQRIGVLKRLYEI